MEDMPFSSLRLSVKTHCWWFLIYNRKLGCETADSRHIKATIIPSTVALLLTAIKLTHALQRAS
jgi:hypothetical protein